MEPIEKRSDIRQARIEANPSEVFAAMRDPARVANWWGPEGFTNTIHQYEFAEGGRWLLTMHGPDGRDYPNESRFARIESNRVLEIEHLNAPHFFLTIELRPDGDGTAILWRQTFDSADQYQRLAAFIGSANEQNLMRLAAEVKRGNGGA